MRTLIPLRGKICINVLPENKRTESGLYIAENIKEVPRRGIVKAIGDNFETTNKTGRTRSLNWNLRVDEIVYFKRNWESKINEDSILRYDEIIAVENKDQELRAFGDHILIERVYMGKIGNSSIIIPESFGVKQNHEDFYGKVISEGPYSTFNLRVDDKIIYHRNEGTMIKHKEKEYFCLKPRAVLAIIKD